MSSRCKITRIIPCDRSSRHASHTITPVSPDNTVNKPLKSICVFCGASPGKRPIHAEAAQELGALLPTKGLNLVYGGGNVGLMGIVANACLAANGHVTGVIPEALVGKEVEGTAVEHLGISRLEVVDSMHTRKARMAELADGFIAMPGGFGTLEELFEVLTWAQLGFHRKPIGLLNVAGYFDPLLGLCDQAVVEGFLRQDSRELLLSDVSAEALLLRMAHHQPKRTELKQRLLKVIIDDQIIELIMVRHFRNRIRHPASNDLRTILPSTAQANLQRPA